MAKRGGRSGRKYVRDNRGRFSSTGATARGGRLKTASGKKRAAQTVKAKTGSKPAGALKAKPRSEGQKYAGRVQAGKDLKRSQSTAREKKFFAETQKRLDAAPLAQSRAAAKPAAAATNTISRSPRQLNKDEKIARDVMTDKRFRSDRQRVTEMRRRGVKPDADVIGLVATVRSKQGGGTTGKIKPAAAKPASARDAATAKLKIKTATRRKLKADRSSVIPANPKARRVQGARIGSTVAKKARAKGNAPATIANRVKRKAAVNKANLRENTRYGNAVDGKQYVRQIKTSMTLDRAQNFLKTGKLPGKDNSIKAQRSFKAANARINANRAARQMSQKEKWAARAEKRRTQANKAEANAKRLRDANRKEGDNAFWTQPGLGKQRDKARAGLDKSFKELERAKKLRSRADNLERMSKRNKGDAASRQQSRRDKFDSRKISKGQTANSTLYGPVKVLRVNKKTVTISLNGGKPFTEDKSRFKEAL
jgi:hypothetical protein